MSFDRPCITCWHTLLQFTWFISGLVGLAISILLVAGILHRQSRLKSSRKTLLLQQQLLRSQMNPHFLFSSLASIQNFIIHKRPSEAGGDYLSRFSKLRSGKSETKVLQKNREKANELRKKYDKDHKSLATSITQERIKVLNRKLRHKITMEIIDLKDEQGEARGTRVVFGMPV
jgi:hypothetical protein